MSNVCNGAVGNAAGDVVVVCVMRAEPGAAVAVVLHRSR